MKIKPSHKSNTPLESLLTHLLDEKAVESHTVSTEGVISFSKKDEQTVTIPLRGIFCSKNFQNLSISSENLEKYTFETDGRPLVESPEFKRLAYSYAAYHYTVHGTTLNKMIREDDYRLTLTSGTTGKLEPKTIENIKAAIILAHGLYQHKPEKTYETYRIVGWPQSFFPLGYQPSVSYYSREPSFMSFSEKSGGLFLNYKEDLEYNFIYNSTNFGVDISSVSHFSLEREILLPPGTEIIYRVINKIKNFTFLEASFVNSDPDQKENKHTTRIPQLKRPSDLIQNYFLEYIYEHFYGMPFKDVNEWEQDAELRHEHIVVYKPNHGVVHALRKMERVIFCILFFSEHSKNKNLAKFCQQLLNQDEITVLGDKVRVQQIIDEIALLTGCTSIGRESEYSFSDNPTKYTEYRRQSVERFLEFLKSKKASEEIGFSISEKRLEVYKEVLAHFGEPEYMQKMSGFHLCIMHLINTPQILDMRRCYDTELSLSILRERLTPIVYSESLKLLPSLMHFGTNWLQLTGDRIVDSDEIIDRQYYKISFLNYSTSDIFQCKKLLRQSAGIFFSKCVSGESESTENIMYKMVEHVSATMILENNKKTKIDRIQITAELTSLIHEMAKLPIPIGLTEQFLEILIKKKIFSSSLSDENKAETLIAAVAEKSISSKIVEQLLEAKCSPNFQNNKGETALMAAVSDAHPDISINKVQLLLDYKADPYLSSEKSPSAVEISKKSSSVAANFFSLKFTSNVELVSMKDDFTSGKSFLSFFTSDGA